MKSSKEHLQRIIEFREKKSRELKRLLSFSEALALWMTRKQPNKRKSSGKKAILF